MIDCLPVMYKPVKTIQDCEVLQKDLDQLHQWEKRWQLRFNAGKCNIMRATHAKKKQLLYECLAGAVDKCLAGAVDNVADSRSL